MDLTALAAGIAVLSGIGNALGEGFVVSHALDGMTRNPEMAKVLRNNMILGCALVETTGIYALLVAIMILFV